MEIVRLVERGRVSGLPADLAAVTIRHTGKRGAEFDIARLMSSDLETLLVASFRRIELPDGRVVAQGRALDTAHHR